MSTAGRSRCVGERVDGAGETGDELESQAPGERREQVNDMLEARELERAQRTHALGTEERERRRFGEAARRCAAGRSMASRRRSAAQAARGP